MVGPWVKSMFKGIVRDAIERDGFYVNGRLVW